MNVHEKSVFFQAENIYVQRNYKNNVFYLQNMSNYPPA